MYSKIFIFILIILILFIASPSFLLFHHIIDPRNSSWDHLVDTGLILDYTMNSLYIAFGVAFLTFILGFSTACLTALFKFTGSKILEFALILPFAIPTYIAALTYGSMFDIDASIININIMSIQGAILVMSLVLYPYVYLISKAYLSLESVSIIEACQTMGLGFRLTLYKIIIPASRPAIIAGVTLATMEAVADYGLMEYFGVKTFVTGIFKAWYMLEDIALAAKLASLLMLVIFSLIIIEKFQRRNTSYKSNGRDFKPINKYKLKGFANVFAFAWCSLIVVLGFLLPLIQLLIWFGSAYDQMLNKDFFKILAQTILLGLAATLLITIINFIFSYSQRFSNNKILAAFIQVIKLNYSVPGAVIAIGVIYLSTLFNNYFEIVLTGTILAIIFGFMIRFSSIAVMNYESGFASIAINYDQTCKTMGISLFKSFRKFTLPLMKGPILVANILIFVEIIKELPLTMILRPFNFETLATLTFNLASFQEQVVEASVPALFIVACSGFSVAILMKNTWKLHCG